MVDQAEIHRMAHSKDVGEWRKVAKALGSAFPHLKDKEQATKDLLALAKYKDYSVQKNAATALSYAVSHYINEKDFKKASQC